jgi:mannose-1-phosphate guanylyltransferase
MTVPVSVLLLAAGIGSRLRPLTDVLPKCLMPVQGRPLLGLWLEMLDDAGIDDITVNTHHHAGLTEDFIRRSPYAKHVTLTHELELLGTGGTLIANYKNFRYDTIMLVHADNLSSFNINAFLQAHAARPPHTRITMMTFDTDVPQQCGIVELDKEGVVVAFHEKIAHPSGTRANAAVYLMDRAFVRELEESKKPIAHFSTDVLPNFIGKIYTWHNARYHRDIGTVENLRRAQEEWSLVDTPARTEPQTDYWYGLLQNTPQLAEFIKDTPQFYI